MNILLAMDKFKGSANGEEVCRAIEKGLITAQPDIHVIKQVMADGGDGSVDLIASMFSGKWVYVEGVQDPLGRRRQSKYYRAGNTAYIELAETSGLVLVKDCALEPLRAHTFGLGQVIKHACVNGCEEVNVFLGGSASTDGGLGALQALGLHFYDQFGQLLKESGGGTLSKICDIQGYDAVLKKYENKIHLICDVTNPFFGSNGAAQVYGKQKGANLQDRLLLDHGLERFAKMIEKTSGENIANISGAGAAGGIAGGFIGLLNAEKVSGIDAFIQWTSMEAKIDWADIIISGEGRVDEQSFQGKVVGGIMELVQTRNKKLILVCGSSALTTLPRGIQSLYTVMDESKDEQDSMFNPLPKLENIGRRIIKSFQRDS
jgi:glycerate kinase